MQNKGRGARELREGKARFKPFGLNVSRESRFKALLSAFLPRGGIRTAEGANGDSEAILWRFGGILLRALHSSLFTFTVPRGSGR